MITETDQYFESGCGRCERFATPDCSTRQWISGLLDLRRICLEKSLVEVVKWGHPCYMFGERNIALIGAFRGDFRLTFFDAALLKDPDGLLEKPGPHSSNPSMIRFTDTRQVSELEPRIKAYLDEAIGYAMAGIKPPKKTAKLDYPAELTEALEADPELAEGFENLTPGRKRSYLINLNSAKQSETRRRRIDRFREKILSGKGATER